MDVEPESSERVEGVNAARPADDAAERQLLVEETAQFAREFHRWVEAQVKGDGMTMPGLRLVERLHCQGPAMMRTLADELGLSPRNVTALVDVLETDGLVVRRPHPSDRRATMVQLTAHGIEAAEALIGPRIRTMGAVFDVLDDDERAQFSALVRRLRVAIADDLPPGTCPKSGPLATGCPGGDGPGDGVMGAACPDGDGAV
jgi:DNA-binding MarR family transcriptional regulator